MNDKERILEELAKEDLRLVVLAYNYAKYMRKYGEDVTRTLLTATENAVMLDKAYRKGYYDAMDKAHDAIHKIMTESEG